MRNFEIAASSPSETGRDRLTAIALYAMPALAVNGALLALMPAIHRRAAAIALATAAIYTLAILTMVAVLSAVAWTDLQGVLGPPMPGFVVSLAGSALLCASAALTLHRART